MNKNPPKLIQCSHFSLCSGCSINEFVDTPPVLKDVERFFGSKGIQVHLHSGNATGWRYRAKLAIRGTATQPVIGLFEEGSHQVIDIPFCKVHHPAINQAVEYLRHFIKAEQIEPYSEQTCSGELRYVQVIVERSSGKVQLSLVWNAKDAKDPQIKKRMRSLAQLGDLKENPGFWHSFWLNFNVRRDNVIFGEKWLLIEGEEYLWEKFGNTDICFHPASFAQANLDLFELMLKKIKQHVFEHDSIVEFYAGVGVIGLSLIDKCRKIVCCEVVPEAKRCFENSRSKLLPALADKIAFQLGSVEKMLHLLAEGQTVIVDPPRKGIHKSLLKALQQETSINKIIYISCGWPAFQRDCDALLFGGWKLKLAEAYLFFPGSNHIEILCMFIQNEAI